MDDIQKAVNAALRQAEIHTTRIAELYLLRPATMDQQIEIITEIASEGVKLAACMSAVFLVAEMGHAMTVIDAESREVAAEAN